MEKNKIQLKAIIRAFHHRNFRLFFIGQTISLIGTWMQRIALGWLIYRLTNSPFMLGLIGFSGQIPTFLFAPFAGVLADRRNCRRILLVTQILSMTQAFILSFLVLTGMIMIWHVIVLSIILGIINGFDMPTRQSFMIEMIEDKKDLGNAIALNSSMVNCARLLGPSAAGILIAVAGEGICFFINGVSFMAVIVSLLLMKIVPKASRAHPSKVWQELKEGFLYTSGFEPIRDILLIFALVSLMGMPYIDLMPVFARDILHGGPDVLGFLMGFSGVGALTGVLYLASRKSVLGLGKMIPFSASLLGLGLIAFSFSHHLTVSMMLMVACGFGQLVMMAACNTLLQTIVDDDKRGRVMSFYIMAFFGTMPVGSLLAGALASKIGAPWTIFIGGAACVAGALMFAKKLPKIREKVRPIYVSMKIIPEIAPVIQSAEELSLPPGRPGEQGFGKY